MAILKYFDRIRALQEAHEAEAPGPLPPFDFESLGSKNAIVQWFTRFLLRRLLPAATFLLRQICPNPRFGRFILVTRAADVEQVLRDMEHFHVVYGLEMRDLGGGADNVLSVDGAAHDARRDMLAKVLRPEDVAHVAEWVAEDAAALLAAGAGRIDAIRDLVTRTATEAACRLFGLTANDPDAFAGWTMAVSNQLFGDFTGDAQVHRQAKIASAQLAGVIDDAIARVRANNDRHPRSRRSHATLIDRLVTDLNVPVDEIRATIIGLVTAFVPTNTLAAGNILEVLLEDGRLWHRAQQAAAAADATAMRAVLFEAGRLNPALSPGLWRHVPKGIDAQVIGTGWRARATRPGDLVLACIPSALRDGRALDDAGAQHRRAWMMFGVGPHDCWGAGLALAHLVAAFLAMFRPPGLREAPGADGRMKRTGAFPVRLDMVYESERARRAMIVAALPVREDVPRAEVEAALDALENPAREDVAKTLAIGDRVQFASLSVIERAPGSEASVLLLEVSGDGEEADLLDHIAVNGFEWLKPVVAFCRPQGGPPETAAELAVILRKAYFKLVQHPFGNTGLHFDGMPELSVADIARQEKVADFARRVIDRRLTFDLGLNTRAMGLLQHTRRLLRSDPFLGLIRENRAFQDEARAEGLRGALLRPGRKRLSIADWQKPNSVLPGIKALLKAPENRFILIGAGALMLAWLTALLIWWSPVSGFGEWALSLVAGTLASLLLALASIGAVTGAVVWRLSEREARDPVDERAALLEHVKAIAAREDEPGFVQNHIIAVMPFKPGLLRRLSFAFAMWGILQTVRFFFRPGFVVTMGTIHKARWFRVPDTEQFVFFSNYDGSWESYLEDFITRAHEGQSAAWSHGVGFPRTRLLIGDGARDGDRFKRWVRRQQRVTRFWYSRFPYLTAQQIRNNAMIEDGLARATSDTDARRWLASFGSAQREPHELEAEEVQSLVFSGLSKMTDATALLVRLPAERVAAGGWLSAVSGLEPHPLASLLGPPDRWLDDKGRKDGPRISLPLEARILFGDHTWEVGGAMLGLTAIGLERCGLDPAGGLDAMPSAFRMTMRARARLLGDGDDHDALWRFHDGEAGDLAAHGLLVLYGHEKKLSHDALVDGHEVLLRHFGGTLVHKVPLVGAPGLDGKPSLEYEHFGFRDGISQPVIKGSRRAAGRSHPRDEVEAGEILVGYRNHQGYVAPSIEVGAERDPACDLPTISAAATNRFPWYGNRSTAYEPRDFGRNGSYLAVRQLDQNVAGFRKQTEQISADLKRIYKRLEELPAHEISPEWLAARIVGRWRDGTPLALYPDGKKIMKGEQSLNDFAYGVDDPRGLACPIGAHIRRTNPRDSQEPGDPDEQGITNRHRLLRRGRPYRYAADGPAAGNCDGLLFMAFCSDLERQFEFVQRTWINSTNFHGLVDEHDPLLGPGPTLSGGGKGHFTVPTAVGPIRIPGIEPHVTLRGGGYFFVPSRSALAHLVTRSLRY